jgi:CHAT domain-containing protein
VDELGSAQRRAAHLATIGTIYAHGQRYHGAPAGWRLQAFSAFDAARQAARESGDGRGESYALGYMGGLYEDEGRHQEALGYSRQAAFLAQANDSPEALYLWQWQIGRARRGLGDTEGSISAYRQSIGTLNQIKGNLVAGSTDTFRERVGPVFFELADLLLKQAATLEDPALVERDLLAVRETIEEVKVAEVQEYFRDACMIGAGSAEAVERVALDAAVIYPILFPDRTELLVSLPSGLKQYTSRIGLEALTREVRDFRREIERYDGQEDYLNHARRLYSWLIEPVIPDLEAEGVETLVMVPDGPLRTIPMSALYDGRQFMIERFAFATTPGLTLTSPQPLAREDVEMLASGLTLSVQGFPALPNVAEELASIESRFPSTVYQDENFQAGRVEDEIARGRYSIVHIATHGQFDSDHTRSFLLTYDDKLTMADLRSTIGARQYRQEPVELLVLSACQTAAGDDRAALGLAGVALQAGARSALATLWFINDESTAQMISEFYRLLEETSVSKAEALRLAQVKLLSDPQYRHPSYWAPFLLIGNWL